MNSFVHQSHDKFWGATITVTEFSGTKKQKVRLRHQSSSKGDFIYLDLEYEQFNGQQPLLSTGELIILVNNSKRYSLRPQITKPATYYKSDSYTLGYRETDITWKEYLYYDISEELLHEMVYAKSLEIKVIGASVSSILKEDAIRPSFIILAKALYNACIDNSMFNQDLQLEKKRIKDAIIEHEIEDMAKKIENEEYEDEVEDEDEDEDEDEENKEIRKEIARRKKSDPRILIAREWEEIQDKIRKKHEFYFNPEDFEEKKSRDERCEKVGYERMYDMLNDIIPLLETFIQHIKDYNSTHPNKIKIDDYFDEAYFCKIQRTLKKYADKIEPEVEKIRMKRRIKRIIIISIIFISIFLLISVI